MSNEYDFIQGPENLPPPTLRVTVGSEPPVEPQGQERAPPPQQAPQNVRPAALPPTQPAVGAPDQGVDDWGPPVDDWEAPSFTEGDIDPNVNTPFAARLDAARASNPNEVALALEQHYGPGNFGQTESGDWWVMQDGKPVMLRPSGMEEKSPALEMLERRVPFGIGTAASSLLRSRMAQNLAADVGATSTPLAASAVGTALGTAGGPLGMAVGSGLGAAAGYGIDQLVKWYRGLYDQSPGEAVGHARNEMLLNMGATAAGPTIRNLAQRGARGFRKWIGMTPESSRMTQQLVNEGARPPLRSVAPSARTWSDKQMLRNAVMGDPWEERNMEYIKRRLGDSMRSSGIPEEEVADVLSVGANQTIAPSRRQAGQELVAAAQGHAGQLRAEATSNRQAAQRILREMENTVRTYAEGTGRQMDALSEDVAETLIRQRRAFGQAAGREYRAIDDLNGGERVFNLDAANARVREIVDLAEPGSVPPYIQRMVARADEIERARAAIPRVQQQIAQVRATGGDPSALQQQLVQLRTQASQNMVTFTEGHEIRNNLRELIGHDFNPTRTPWVGKLSRVEDAIDDTFRAMEDSGGLPGQAATRLRAADEQYRRGIQVFKDAQVNKLIRDIRSGVGVDPEAVAETIMKVGRTQSGRRILNVLPEELRENVARADMRNILHEASVRGRDGERVLDGMKFLDALQNRKRAMLLTELHSQQEIASLENLARHLAAMDGKISVDSLPPSALREAIAGEINRLNQLDTFVRQNPVGALASGTPEQIDRAARALATPGNEAMTIQGAQFFGVNSPEWRMVQRHATERLVRSALMEKAGNRMTVSGPSLERALRNYTAEQQELLFPGGMADDLREVAKQAKFLFPSINAADEGMATSQAAKSITLHAGPNIFNPWTLRADLRYLHTMTMGWLIDHPRILKFVAGAAKKDPTEARAVMNFVLKTVMNTMVQGPGSGRPSNGNAQ